MKRNAMQGLPPPPPKPSAPSVAPTPTPAQQTPTAPTQEPSDEQEPEQSSSQQQQQQPPAAQEKGPANDQLVPQPAVDQNRPPVKPQQRRPSAPAASQVTLHLHVLHLYSFAAFLRRYKLDILLQSTITSQAFDACALRSIMTVRPAALWTD